MSELLPLVFIALSGLALSAVLYALWHSVRMLLTADDAGNGGGPLTLAEREALVSEKQDLLTTIHELQFEHDLGKISKRDFERLDNRYRARARNVLKELDLQLSPYRDEAQRMLDQAMGEALEPSSEASSEASLPAPEAGEATASSAEASTVTCPACKQTNDTDAIFCKKCAQRLGSQEVEAAR